MIQVQFDYGEAWLKMTHFEHNIVTGEIIERELTKAEKAEKDALQLRAQQEASAIAEKEAEVAAAKAALYARLGITADEAKLLLS